MFLTHIQFLNSSSILALCLSELPSILIRLTNFLIFLPGPKLHIQYCRILNIEILSSELNENDYQFHLVFYMIMIITVNPFSTTFHIFVLMPRKNRCPITAAKHILSII